MKILHQVNGGILFEEEDNFLYPDKGYLIYQAFVLFVHHLTTQLLIDNLSFNVIHFL